MSQEQQSRMKQQDQGVDPINYGDVFNVAGDLAGQPVAPQDAAMMQSAEVSVFGQPHTGDPGEAMKAASAWNERAGLVGHSDVSDAAAIQDVAVTESSIPGGTVVTQSVAGQVVGQFVEAGPIRQVQVASVTQVMFGEALEAAAQMDGNKPVDWGDVAAIHVVEKMATGINTVLPGGITASAQSAAAYNEATLRYEDKIMLSHVLAGACGKLPRDRAVAGDDVEGVAKAEMTPGMKVNVHPGQWLLRQGSIEAMLEKWKYRTTTLVNIVKDVDFCFSITQCAQFHRELMEEAVENRLPPLRPLDIPNL